MKNSKHWSLHAALLLVAGVNWAGAQGAAVFPIAANPAIVEVVGGAATSGTNSLAAILSGTNVCFQVLSSAGALIGPPTTIGQSTALPLAAFAGGAYLVYWEDNFTGSECGQIISPVGMAIGSAFDVGPGTPRALASDGANFLAVMEEHDDYLGQVVSPQGTLDGPPFLISSQPGNESSAAAIFGRTNYLVVWEVNNPGTGNGNNVYGEFVSPTGSTGSPFQISQSSSLDNNPLTLAFAGTNYLVIWDVDTEEFPNGAPVWNLHGRLVSQDGVFPGNEFVIATNQPIFPSVAFDGVNYLLAWGFNDDRTNAGPDIFLQFFNPAGNPIGPAFPPFLAQGANAPLFGAVLFDGKQFEIFGDLGSLILSGDGGIQGFASAADYVTFIPASTTPPTMAVSGLLAGGQFPLSLAGTPGINYAIQVSTNLAGNNWTAIATNSPTNGPFSFTGTNATNRARFYRAVMQ